MIRATLTATLLFAAFPAAASCAAAADTPNVVVSIKPIHSLVAGVMADIGEPTLLIAGGASPHTYTLRPSQARALQKADAVFWIGDELETFLVKPLQALPRDTAVVALHEAPGVRRLSFREGGPWYNHAHDPHDDDASHRAGGDEHGETDMHVWLDPRNAEAMVATIVETLADVDAVNADRYRANGDAVVNRINALDAALDKTLAPVKGRPYIVFHDAYQYLEGRYGLTPAGAITVNPDRPPGAKRLSEIRRAIIETGAICVFREPQFEPALIATVVEGTPARTAILDPMGADTAPGPDAYFDLMQGLAIALKDCLLPSS